MKWQQRRGPLCWVFAAQHLAGRGRRHISPRGFTDSNDLEFWERKWLVLCQVNSQLQETARDTHLFTVPSSVRVQTISVGPHWLYLQSVLYSMVESFPQGQCLSRPDSINVLATVSYIFPSILADCLLSHITTYTFLLHSVNTFFFSVGPHHFQPVFIQM